MQSRESSQRQQVTCPHCGACNPYRTARKGLLDAVHSWVNRWPYRCRACRRKFYSSVRRSARRSAEGYRPAASHPGEVTVDCRTKAETSTAAIVVQAEDNEQLTHILLALSKAVEVEQQRSHGVVRISERAGTYEGMGTGTRTVKDLSSKRA